jgi:crotonobetainyl-CoA:carnitine CoA-transferase CaiB-like acyl-CoA transferase
MGLAELDTAENAEQPGRWKNRDIITRALSDALRERSCEEWLAILRPAGVPCAPVNDVHAVLNDPHLHARNMIVDVPHVSGRSVRQAGNPVKLSAAGEDTFSPPPRVGEHTHAVLTDLLGYSESALSELRTAGVIQ